MSISWVPLTLLHPSRLGTVPTSRFHFFAPPSMGSKTSSPRTLPRRSSTSACASCSTGTRVVWTKCVLSLIHPMSHGHSCFRMVTPGTTSLIPLNHCSTNLRSSPKRACTSLTRSSSRLRGALQRGSVAMEPRLSRYEVACICSRTNTGLRTRIPCMIERSSSGNYCRSCQRLSPCGVQLFLDGGLC